MRKQCCSIILLAWIIVLISMIGVIVLASPPHAAIQLASASHQAYHSSPILASNTSNARHFHVEVSRNGFNGSWEPVSLIVVEGDSVTVEFVYADNDLSYDNPHRMFVEGYNLQTGVINRQQTVTILQFIASKTGTFSIYCDVPCAGMMYLQNASLVVSEVSGTQLPTSLILIVQHADRSAGLLRLLATVSDDENQPLERLPVDFFARTTFGLLSLGTELTNAQGVATLDYTPTVLGETQITAIFSGGGNFARSENSVTVSIERATGSVASYQPILALPRLLALSLVVVIVGSVWISYGVVLNLIRKLHSAAPHQAHDTRVSFLDPTGFTAAVGFFAGVALLGALTYTFFFEMMWPLQNMAFLAIVVLSGVETVVLVLVFRRAHVFSAKPHENSSKASEA